MGKDFKNPKVSIAPEMQFFSQESIEAVDGKGEADKPKRARKTSKPKAGSSTAPAPEGLKVNPLYVETKSKRVQLVLQPSLYTKVKSKADQAGLSFNEYCHRLLEEATREE